MTYDHKLWFVIVHLIPNQKLILQCFQACPKLTTQLTPERILKYLIVQLNASMVWGSRSNLQKWFCSAFSPIPATKALARTYNLQIIITTVITCSACLKGAGAHSNRSACEHPGTGALPFLLTLYPIAHYNHLQCLMGAGAPFYRSAHFFRAPWDWSTHPFLHAWLLFPVWTGKLITPRRMELIKVICTSPLPISWLELFLQYEFLQKNPTQEWGCSLGHIPCWGDAGHGTWPIFLHPLLSS